MAFFAKDDVLVKWLLVELRLPAPSFETGLVRQTPKPWLLQKYFYGGEGGVVISRAHLY